MSQMRIPGSEGLQFEITSDVRQPFGTIMEMPDGQEFVYARAGALDLAIARVMQESVVVSGHETALAVYQTTAIGATEVKLTNATTAMTKDMYAGGTIFIKDGQCLKIKSHPAEATGSGTVVMTLEEGSALKVALTTASRVGLRKHKCDGVLIAPISFTGVVAGVTVCAVTALYCCWLLTKGRGSVLTNGTLVLGRAVNRSETTPGAVDVYPLNSVDTSGQQPMLGFVETVGATAEYSLVNFNIQ